MKHNKKTTGFEPHKLSKEINANVVVDDRLKNRTINGGYVAWPADNKKEATEPSLLQKAVEWFKVIRSGNNGGAFSS